MVRLVVAFAGYKNFRNFFVPLYKCKKILFLLHSGGINFEGKQILRLRGRRPCGMQPKGHNSLACKRWGFFPAPMKGAKREMPSKF